MAEDANGASHGQALGELSLEPLPAISKRKPDADPETLDESRINEDKKAKLQSPEASDEGAADPIATGNGHENKPVPVAVDKGKGILVEVVKKKNGEDDEVAGDNSDSDDESSDSDDDAGIWAGLDDEDTDFDDDPLAEVDLDNILPSRTRRREPPPPGAYLVNDMDDEDSDESE